MSTVLLVKVTRLDGVLAIGIQCRPPDQTKKVLDLGNQKWSDLQVDTKVCGYFTGSFFIRYSKVQYSP